jgi:hypothetical protein
MYAATRLASRPFREADLATRGLIWTMEMECWVNHKLPSTTASLAKVLGFDACEIEAALPVAMSFFDIDDNREIYSPQLEDYRKHLSDIRDKQKAGGKKGAAITNKKTGRSAKHAVIDIEGNAANTQVEARVSSKAKLSTVKQSQNQPSERAVTDDPFVRDYESTESCMTEDYAKASGRR